MFLFTDADKLAECARGAMRNAYAPYSGYCVGAALLGKSGRVYIGCNIENAAYSPSVCAERAAVACAVSAGEREFEALAVCGGKGGAIAGPCPPCGVCRQTLREFCSDDFKVIVVDGPDSYVVHTLGELLPHSFGRGNIEA